MRFQGKIKTWDDERGSGFIAPIAGGESIFVHVKDCLMGSYRPRLDQHVSFEVEIDPRGRKHACRVEPICAPIPRLARREPQLVRWGSATLFAIPAFLLLYWLVALLWRSPPWLPAVYLAVSLVTYGVYALDKSTAKMSRRRRPENTLHLLSLLGGWPGALIAQQLVRHKSSQAGFRRVFWGTVAFNVLAFVLISSPLVQPIWAV